MNEALLAELTEWLRIPSISSGGGDPDDLRRAAEWAAEKIHRAKGHAEVVDTGLNPLVVGELRSPSSGAPTVLIYGHYDVQSADPVDAWESPPFDPVIRDGRLYARGAADDKGNFFPLFYVACELAAAGTLPVNVKVLVDGEEEIGGDSASKWVLDDETADCALIFDAEMLDARTPAVTLGARGLVAARISVRVARADLHSGLYGGTVLNAVHVLNGMLQNVLPGPDGRLRPELRAGVVGVSSEEREAWAELPTGEALFEDVGGRPHDESAASDYYERNWADASIDVNGIVGGDAVQLRTIIPAEACAVLTVRLAPNQDSGEIAETLERLLLDAASHGADVGITIAARADPALFDPTSKAVSLARRAFESACGTAPVLVRSGGTLPILAALAKRDVPTILSGFALPDDGFHAPNESFRLRSLELGEASARALYRELAELKD